MSIKHHFVGGQSKDTHQSENTDDIGLVANIGAESDSAFEGECVWISSGTGNKVLTQ